jgi:hypothetical protein
MYRVNRDQVSYLLFHRVFRIISEHYCFLDHESIDNGFKTSLVYRLNDKMSFEVRHNFETRRYEDDANKQQTNLTNRSVTIGLIFDLN